MPTTTSRIRELTILAMFGRSDRFVDHDARAFAGDGGPPSGHRSGNVSIIVIILLAGLVLLAIGYLVGFRLPSSELELALTETDRLSPGWRLDDLEAARERVPDERNAALLVMAMDGLIPPNSQNNEDTPSAAEARLRSAMGDHSPGKCLEAEDVRSLRTIHDALKPGLADARGLADLPDGRFPISWTRDGLSTRLPHLKIMPEVATLLSYDALLRAHDGDVNGALASCRAALNAGRSVGDEPLLVSQSRRMLVREQACRQIEYTLTHGESSDATLAALQQHLENEDAQPLLWFGLRGERACADRFLAWIGSGKLSKKEIENVVRSLQGVSLDIASVAKARAALLRYYLRTIEIATRPPEELEIALSHLAQSDQNVPTIAKAFMPSLLRIATTYRRSRAQLRCATTALAAERYRLARGHWPASLEGLVPDFLSTVPTDPIDGKPLRFHRLADGIVIDSGDRDDGKATAEARSINDFDDLGFRLWDLPLRHHPVKPGS